MENKDSIRENEITDLEKLSRIAGGLGPEMKNVPAEVMEFFRVCLKTSYKDKGYTMEQAVEKFKEFEDMPANFVKMIPTEWDKL